MLGIPGLGRAAALGLATLVAGCGGSSSAPEDDATQASDVTIRTTTGGIPHIKADDYRSLGYGVGYVQARDNLCVLAEDFLTIEGQRAEFLGRDGSYTIHANGATASNVDSDFFWRFLITDARLQELAETAIPEAEAASRGFAAGYSRYVSEIKNGQHAGRHQSCRGADWVRPIDLSDMYRRYIRLGVLASSSVFPTEIANAAPPGAGAGGGAPDPQELLDLLPTDALPFELPENLGSNMYGLGADATQNGQSMLFGNPHFPWRGTERLYQMQLTLTGDKPANIFGSSLYGVPAILIGFNEHLAWSHTVSTAFRFTFYELKLNPADPTQYLFDGEFVDMESEDVSIQIQEDDGSLTESTRTLYRSRFGPMLELSVSGVPVLSWNGVTAYTLRDANLENTRLIEQFFRWNRADSLDEFIDLHGDVLGIPWVNTVAVGPGQDAYYGDVSVVPNVPDSKVQTCPSLLTPVFLQLMPGLPVLDGSRSDCDWDSDDDAPADGIFGPANLPTQRRSDYVTNCNDSYWLTNPAEPITGFASIIGAEESERSLRTRLCILHAQERIDGSDAQTIGNVVDGLEGNTGFTLDNLQDITLSSHIYSARLARGAVVNQICNPTGMVLSSSGPVDASAACQALADWDMATNLDSRGGHLWREFFTRAQQANLPLWLTPFDANDPVDTPRDLNVANPEVQLAFGDAINAIDAAGFAPDAPMGDIQYSGVHPEDRIPIFGGVGNRTGSFTVVGDAPLDETGYPVKFGNSYIQTVTWDPGCRSDCTPIAEGFVTYSQSTDPANPHYKDQTQRYSAKNWVRFPFTEAEIAADPNLTVERLSE